jgi:hypothetical protein
MNMSLSYPKKSSVGLHGLHDGLNTHGIGSSDESTKLPKRHSINDEATRTGTAVGEQEKKGMGGKLK